MKKNLLLKYYRVFKNETAVTEISTNDFKPVPAGRFKHGTSLLPPTDANVANVYPGYSLPGDSEMFYGYASKTMAMRKAKAGALLHINRMIEEVVQGIQKLKDYRNAHHEDLNTTLLEGNIRALERQMYIK